MKPSDKDPLKSFFLSEEQWAEQAVLDHLRQTIQSEFASLTHSEQFRYRQLVRQYAQALENVVREDKKIKDDFEAEGVQSIRTQLLELTGKDLDPHTTYIHTRYLHVPEKEFQWPKRVRRSLESIEEATGTENLPEPQAILDKRTPVAHVLSMSLWQAACMNFGFLSYFKSFNSDSLVNASFINHSPGANFSFAVNPDDIDTASIIPANTFITVARRLNLGSQLKTRINKAMSSEGELHKFLRICTKAHLQFCLLELYRTSGLDHVAKGAVRELSDALDTSSSQLRIRQVVMVIKFTLAELASGKGYYPAGGLTFSTTRAPEDETDGYHVSIPLFQIERQGTASVFSFFPGRPNGELRQHANDKALIADFRRQLLRARADNEMEWFNAHLTHTLYEKLTEVAPQPVDPSGFNVLSRRARIRRNWINFEGLGFKLLSPTYSLEGAVFKFQSDLYDFRLSQLATERSVQDWTDVVSAVSTLLDEVAGIILTPVPGGTQGLTKVIQLLFTGVTARNIYNALEQASQNDNSGLASTLIDTVDILLTSVLMGSAGRLAQRRHAKLFQRLGQPRTYTRSDGRTDLWVSDPAHFSLAPASVTDAMKLDEQGIYSHAGRDYAFLEKDGQKFVVQVERNLDGTWRAIVKADLNAFKPPVVWSAPHKRWQLDLDDSPTLTDVQLLRRMVRGMTAEAAHTALTISAVSRADLQRIWQGERAPASLTDAITRFQADTQLQRCADELSRYPQTLSLTERPLLALLTQLQYWPKDILLFVLNHDGKLIEVHGQFSASDVVYKSLTVRRLDDGELTLNNSTFTKAFSDDLLSGLIKQLSLQTDTRQLTQLLASQLEIHKESLFTALTLHKDQLPTGGMTSSLALNWLPLEGPKSTQVSPVIIKLQSLHVGLSLARCHELLGLHPTLANYRTQLDETLYRRTQRGSYALPEPLHRAITGAVFSARLERMLDGMYHPRAFNPDVDQWSKDLCTRIIKHLLNIELVIIATSNIDPPAAEYMYSDRKLIISDLGSGAYAAYDRKKHAFIPAAIGPDSFYHALIAALSSLSRTQSRPSPNLLTVAGWRKVLVDDLSAFRGPDGFINKNDPQVDTYSLPDVRWQPDIKPNAQGIYTLDDVPCIVLDGKRYEVQSATDGFTNRIMDNNRFARAPIALLGNGEGTWRHVFERPMEWQGQYLFRRLGYSAEGFDSNQISAILDVSNTSEEMLRRVHVNQEKLPPLLSDTLQRFPRDNHVAVAESQTHPSFELIKRVFPGLSDSLVVDLIHSANEFEVTQMRDGRVPLRLSQEALWYLHEVRINRAIEGLYLSARQNNDSVKLMVHWLSTLSGWSAALKVEVREDHASGRLICSSGGNSARVQLTVIKTAQGWQIFAASDPAAKASGQDFFIALLNALPDRERQALGHAYAGGADLLKEQLILKIVENRVRAYELIGMGAKQPWFIPPTRLADGRIGYSWSGRGSGTDRYFADIPSRQRYERIYPASADGQSARALERMRALNLDVEQELTRLEHEVQVLQQQLSTWLTHRPDFDTHDVLAQQHKQEMASELRKAWRKETPPLIDSEGNVVGYSLALNNWRVPTLPVLTADFSHIRQLHMTGMRVGAGMAFGVEANFNQFLLGFRSLTSLKVEFCGLASLPSAIGQMAGLLELSLAYNFLSLVQSDQQRLGGLVQLQRLSLVGCTLHGRFDVRALTQLRELNLSNTEAVIWPQGVMQLPHLVRLDLSRNHIITVPAEVLSGSETINRGTALQENDLTPATLNQLRDYQGRTGINFGLHHDANHPPRLDFDDLVWLHGLAADERLIRYQACQLLREDPRALSFFKLIDDLKTTADYELIKDDLVVRVQSVLQEAAANEQVRNALFSLASIPRKCCDAVSLLFSQLEVQVLVAKALAEGDPNRAERSLARIVRGEFRLEVLDSFAYEECRKRSGPFDELEIGFTYRLKLKAVLDLPAQPKHMKFVSLGFVEQAVIDQAGVKILAMDNGEAMLDYMTNDPMWDRFLRNRYADQFEAVYNASHRVVRGRDIYDAERYARELQALVNRLTLDALAKLNSN